MNNRSYLFENWLLPRLPGCVKTLGDSVKTLEGNQYLKPTDRQQCHINKWVRDLKEETLSSCEKSKRTRITAARKFAESTCEIAKALLILCILSYLPVSTVPTNLDDNFYLKLREWWENEVPQDLIPHLQNIADHNLPRYLTETPNSGNRLKTEDLSRLLGIIFELQKYRKFPQCELYKLNLLTEKQTLHWDKPALISPSEVWDEQFSSMEIFHTVRSSVQGLPRDCIIRAGEPIERERSDWNVSNAFYQATIPLEHSDASDKSSIMNVSLPKKFRRLRPCQTLRNQLRIVRDNDLDLLANFAPAGSTVDIHIDQNRHGLSQSLGQSQRIWLLWPPTKDNLEVFTRYSGETGRLTKISGELTGGYIACVDSSLVVYLPPGWLHATFTTRAGTLVGINFESLECLEIMAQSTSMHMIYFQRIKQTVLEDLCEYGKALSFFLDDEYEPQILTTVLKSWVIFMDGQLGLALQHSEFRSAMLTLLEGLEEGLSGKEAYCCGKKYSNVLAHVRSNHWINISNRKKLSKRY